MSIIIFFEKSFIVQPLTAKSHAIELSISHNYIIISPKLSVCLENVEKIDFYRFNYTQLNLQRRGWGRGGGGGNLPSRFKKCFKQKGKSNIYFILFFFKCMEVIKHTIAVVVQFEQKLNIFFFIFEEQEKLLDFVC